MKRYKIAAVCLVVLCFAFMLSACNGKERAEFTSLQSFEYHFYPEEYEEEYSDFEKSFTLDADTDYQFQVDANCESGTMEISINYGSTEEKLYIVSSAAPCDETISIPANTSDTVSFMIHIEADTKGAIVGELLRS